MANITREKNARVWAFASLCRIRSGQRVWNGRVNEGGGEGSLGEGEREDESEGKGEKVEGEGSRVVERGNELNVAAVSNGFF